MSTSNKNDGDGSVHGIVSLPTEFQTFIHLSRYARYRDDLGRRETWEETIDRYLNYFENYLKENYKASISKFEEKKVELRNALLSLDIMPSMRALMTAGKALEHSEISQYNCSFSAVDGNGGKEIIIEHEELDDPIRIKIANPIVFDEIMFILMNGVGAGFSVEHRFVKQLPKIGKKMNRRIYTKNGKNFPGVDKDSLSGFDRDTNTVIVEDCREGWASALRIIIVELFNGNFDVKWNLKKIRPAGTRLKTFGGRASGPAPLDELFRFCVQTFKNANGRKLKPIECHDVVCKIASVVIAGSSRRSALISLSDLDDTEMRYAKNGTWWDSNPQRALANNSVSYKERPNMDMFMREWKALIESKAGERGIFNLSGVQEHTRGMNKRNADLIEGVNPCQPDTEWVLTTNGPRQIKDLIDVPFTAVVEGIPRICKNGFVKTGEQPIYKIITKRGYEVITTDNHPFYHLIKKTQKTEYKEWKALRYLKIGTQIKLCAQNWIPSWDGDGNEEEGYLLGQLVGDGCFYFNKKQNHHNSGLVRFWGTYAVYMAAMCLSMVKNNLFCRTDVGVTTNGIYHQVHCCALFELAMKYGIEKNKDLSSILEKTSSSFQRGFLSGFFDADGTIAKNTITGASIRLAQSNIDRLKVIQRILSSFGIYSSLYQNRNPSGYRNLPDGNGGMKEYFCVDSHELCIANDNIQRFAQHIGFKQPDKKQKLDELLKLYARKPNRERHIDTIESIELYSERASVYGCNIEEVHEYDSGGIRLHNCGEIKLRNHEFCNLSSVVIRPEDTEIELMKKVEYATILGTIQSLLTDFKYISDTWKKNCEEERLLGVSMSGILDNPLTAGIKSHDETAALLQRLKQHANDVNAEWADIFSVNHSAAITTVKPEGTSALLNNTASGIHPRYARFYIRTVRIDKKDPLAQFMVDNGFPVEDDVTNPDHTAVFSFPMIAPCHSILRNELTALDQLNLWHLYAMNWCEHNPSITIYVRDNEWLEVGAWVYKNFNDVRGISFLPYTDHIYKQAPYQEISEELYKKLMKLMPKHVDWATLSKYENEDNTVGSQALACSSGSCEAVDLVSK